MLSISGLPIVEFRVVEKKGGGTTNNFKGSTPPFNVPSIPYAGQYSVFDASLKDLDLSISVKNGLACEFDISKVMTIDRDIKRVMIIGQPGSGKSTLARDLGNLLDIPVFYIDKIHWQSGWIEREGHEKDRLCSEVHSRDRWVFEGGRSSTWKERLDRADMLIWLDFPLRIRSWRIFIRTIRYYGESRPDLPEGCPERFSFEFI